MHFRPRSGMQKSHLAQPKGTRSIPASRSNTESIASPPQGLWTARVAANCAGFQSPVTVLRAFRRGELPGYQFGPRSIRFAPEDVRAWVKAAMTCKEEGGYK